MNFAITSRRLYVFLFLISAFILAYAYQLQFNLGLEPCPLCVLQRIGFFLLGIFSLITAMVYRIAILRFIFASLAFLSSLAGMAIAARQVWLQHLPAGQAPACGPGLYFIIKNWPLGDAIKLMLKGTAECSVVTWKFLNLSIAEWSLLLFFGFAICLFALFFWRERPKKTSF